MAEEKKRIEEILKRLNTELLHAENMAYNCACTGKLRACEKWYEEAKKIEMKINDFRLTIA